MRTALFFLLSLVLNFSASAATWAKQPAQRIFVSLEKADGTSSSPSTAATLQEALKSVAQMSLAVDTGAVQVLADLLLEKGSSYGQFLSLLTQSFANPNLPESRKLRRSAQRILDRDFGSWFPKSSLFIGMSDWTSTWPSGVFLGPQGIEGFEFHSFRALEGFFARGGADVVKSWQLQAIRLEEGGRDSVGSRKVAVFKNLAAIRTLRALDLQFPVQGSQLRALRGSSIRKLTLSARALTPYDLMSLTGIQDLESLILEFPLGMQWGDNLDRRMMHELFWDGVRMNWQLSPQWDLALNQLQAKFARPIDLKIYLDPGIRVADDQSFSGFKSVNIIRSTSRRRSCRELLLKG